MATKTLKFQLSHPILFELTFTSAEAKRVVEALIIAESWVESATANEIVDAIGEPTADRVGVVKVRVKATSERAAHRHAERMLAKIGDWEDRGGDEYPDSALVFAPSESRLSDFMARYSYRNTESD